MRDWRPLGRLTVWASILVIGVAQGCSTTTATPCGSEVACGGACCSVGSTCCDGTSCAPSGTFCCGLGTGAICPSGYSCCAGGCCPGAGSSGGSGPGLCVAADNGGCPTCTEIGDSDPACTSDETCCGLDGLQFCTNIGVAACIQCNSASDCQTGAQCCHQGVPPSDGGKDTGSGLSDPCGVAGTWSSVCPLGSSACSACGTATATASYTISASIAQSGGSWTESDGTGYSFTVSDCTLTKSIPVSNPCFTGTRTYSVALSGGTGSYSHAFTCWTNSTCNCTGNDTCTDTRQ